MSQLDEILRFARQNFIPVMLDDTRALLKKLVSERKPRRILEIGTAIGYSGIIMLSASPEAVLNTIEINEESAKLAKENFKNAGVDKRANVFIGDAKEIVTELTGSYDFVFMDGPKGQYEVFLPYVVSLLEVGGTLVCDNVLYKGLVENVPDDKRHKHITIARNMNAFLHDIQNDDRFTTQLLRIGDGVTVSQRIK